MNIHVIASNRVSCVCLCTLKLSILVAFAFNISLYKKARKRGISNCKKWHVHVTRRTSMYFSEMRLKYVSKEWQLHGFIWRDTIAQNPTQFCTMHVLCERWPLVKALSIWRRRTRPKKTLIKTRARLTCETCLPRYDELWLLFVKYSSILSQDNSCSVDIQSLSCLVRSLTWGNENNAGRRPVVASGFFTNLKSGLFVSRMRERKGDCEFASCTLDLRTCHLPLRVSNTINFHRFQFAFRGSTLSPFPSAVARLRFSRSFAGGCQNRIKDDIKAFWCVWRVQSV